ncbi:MAG: NAD(P)/FAD-dependent oxidoreductase [Acidimicrobiia bacterium]|nr:NAD(P)/FAD-dependent oxidoreductase [Acidimicrobiia bacterium]
MSAHVTEPDRSAAVTAATPPHLDAVVVGAGFAGMYMLIRLRDLGLTTLVVESGTDVGGTWYWNRYPGARCDVPSMEYSYSFSDELQQDWRWSEVMSPQPEILDYARHVADRFDLRRDIRFGTRVLSAHFDDDAGDWTVTTDRGDTFRARYCIMATGCLSAANTPAIPGLSNFAGTVLHTGNWPHEPVDLARRIGIIGTGSSGVQAIPVLAEHAQHLHVFQRTPVYTFPARNKPLRDDIQAAYKDHYAEVRERQRHSATGFSGFSPLAKRPASRSAPAAGNRPRRPDIRDLSADERREAWAAYGFGLFQRYRDIYTDLEANEAACDLYRDHVHAVVADPDIAERLSPRGYPLGCKRQVLDTGYYETFNRPNVTLVDLRSDPIVEVTAGGIRTRTATIPLDVIVLATGFDAMTGALDRIDIRGRSGRSLREEWAHGPRAYLGLQVEGFPNLFTITGPGSPSVLANVIVAIEHHVEWIAGCIEALRAQGLHTIEPTADAQESWAAHVNEVAEGTMYTAPTCNSWYLGANIEGKARTFMPYVGGLGRYRARCDEIVANGYEGFVRA